MKVQGGVTVRRRVDAVTISSTSVQYASSSSGTAVPTSGWQADIPTMEDGKYLWTWTRVLYTDGNSTDTYSVSRWGVDGKGIQSSVIKYCQKADTTASPGDFAESDWGDFPTSLTEGWWLYTRTHIVYSDGSETDSYSVSQIGTGAYYAGLQEYYALSNSGASSPGGDPVDFSDTQGQIDYVDGIAVFPAEETGFAIDEGTWSTACPEPYGRMTYIWNFSVSYDSAGNKYVSQPVCIGNYARGIASIVETYAISAYSTAGTSGYPSDLTAASWTDEQQDAAPTDARPYQWNKTLTTYTDGTTTTVYHISAVRGTAGTSADWHRVTATGTTSGAGAPCQLMWDSSVVYSSSSYGMHLVTLSTSGAVISSAFYAFSEAGMSSLRAALPTASGTIVCVIGYYGTYLDPTTMAALASYGMKEHGSADAVSGDDDTAFAFIGEYGLAAGRGWESIVNGDGATATVTAAVTNGALQYQQLDGKDGTNGTNGDDGVTYEVLASSESAIVTPPPVSYDGEVNWDSATITFTCSYTVKKRVGDTNMDVSGAYLRWKYNTETAGWTSLSGASPSLYVNVAQTYSNAGSPDSVLVEVYLSDGTLIKSLSVPVVLKANTIITNEEGIYATTVANAESYSQMKLTVDSIETTVNNHDGEISQIQQDAEKISLKVWSEASGSNLLKGAGLRSLSDGPRYVVGANLTDSGWTHGGGICLTRGIGGTNAFMARNRRGDTTEYCGLYFGYYGDSNMENIEVGAGKSYLLSCYVKCSSTAARLMITLYGHNGARAARVSSTPLISEGNSVTVSAADTWERLAFVLTVPSGAAYTHVEAVFLLAMGTAGQQAEACFCRPSLEEVDPDSLLTDTDGVTVTAGAQSWSTSAADADYVGGNMLADTDTMGADVTRSGVTVASNGYEDSSAADYTVTSSDAKATSLALLSWTGLALEAGSDYVLSFMAKGTAGVTAGISVGCAYVEADGTMTDATKTASFSPAAEWKRYSLHLHTLPGGDYSSVTASLSLTSTPTAGNTISIARPKLERGATLTEWTAKRSDMVSEAALLATGIDIKNRQITLTADKTFFQTNSGEPTALIDEDGVHAAGLETVNKEEGYVSIKNGLMQVFNPDGVCQMRIGYKNGNMVLSYFDADGNLLYDLGPDGIDTSVISDSGFTKYSRVSIGSGAYSNYVEDVSLSQTKKDGTTTSANYVTLAETNDDTKVFGNGTSGPLTTDQATLYLYRAGKVNNAYAADSAAGLTAAQAELADGKLFTATSGLGGSGNSLNYLASGTYTSVTVLDVPVTNVAVEGDTNTVVSGSIPTYKTTLYHYTQGVLDYTETVYSKATKTIG